MDLQKMLKDIDVDKAKQDLRRYIDATSKEEAATAPELAIYLPLDPATSKLFTKERLRLLCLLRDEGERTVSELAEALERNLDAVSRDVRFLVNMGVIEIERDEADGRKRIVRLYSGEIRIPLA